MAGHGPGNLTACGGPDARAPGRADPPSTGAARRHLGPPSSCGRDRHRPATRARTARVAPGSTSSRSASALRTAKPSQSLLKYAKTSAAARARERARPTRAARPRSSCRAARGDRGGSAGRPVGGQDLGRRHAAQRVVADHQRRAVPAQERVDRLGEPARVAELERVAARGQVLERRGEALVVAPEALRQLPQRPGRAWASGERGDRRRRSGRCPRPCRSGASCG